LWSYLPPEWGGPAVNALGYGGQLIAIVPDIDTIIVIASTTNNPANDTVRVLRETLMPAL
jgi:CubicO group peptidase (beta-lactamase class C family)